MSQSWKAENLTTFRGSTGHSTHSNYSEMAERELRNEPLEHFNVRLDQSWFTGFKRHILTILIYVVVVKGLLHQLCPFPPQIRNSIWRLLFIFEKQHAFQILLQISTDNYIVRTLCSLFNIFCVTRKQKMCYGISCLTLLHRKFVPLLKTY